MAQTAPWYSIRQRDGLVYHDDDHCPLGREIEEKYRRKGRRCRQQCRACAQLRDPARQAARLAELMPL
jgi:hypothetical protein